MNADRKLELESGLRKIRERLEPAFAPDTAARGFHGTTASTGHCAAVAVILNEEFGGEFASALVQGSSHWFNRLRVDGEVVDVDITGDQFNLPAVRIERAGELFADARLRGPDEVTLETFSRGRVLAQRAGLARIAAALASTMSALQAAGRARGPDRSK